jgi:hypothetical protein
VLIIARYALTDFCAFNLTARDNNMGQKNNKLQYELLVVDSIFGVGYFREHLEYVHRLARREGTRCLSYFKHVP